jgi:hypothetical protein
MAQIREIKCPNCGEWTLWNGDIDDRCLYCGGFLERERFVREVEQKIRTEVKKENDYFAIKPGDGPVKKQLKLFLNSIRWILYYLGIAIFILVAFMLMLISIL